jgi:cytochrome c-type biogenesis protein CcmH
MRCLVCQNESLAGSRSDLANDLRREIRTLIKEGKNDDQIRSFMVERYGDFVLYRPPVKPTTWLLWIGPFIILLIGIAGLLTYLRRRNNAVSNIPLSDDDNKRIDALLNNKNGKGA